MVLKRGKVRSIKERFILIVLFASVPFFLAVSSSAIIVYSVSSRQLQREVENATTVLHNLINSMLKNSVRSYLRSKVETGVDIIERITADAAPGENGEIRPETVGRIVEALDSLQVGGSGYFYVIRPDGKVLIHPDRTILGTNFSDREPVNEQIRMLDGYLEYLWQNSDETEPRKKALYMSYIPELDWILSATSYRDEFTAIVELEGLRDTVKTVSLGPGGYSYVIARDGTFIAHPYLSGNKVQGLISDEEFRSIISHFFSEGEGTSSYPWRDSTGDKMREKYVNFKYLPDFDWVVGTAFYHDEIGHPIELIVLINVGFAFIIAIFLSLTIYRMNRSIEHYILHISSVLRASLEGDPSMRASREGPGEIAELAGNLNLFLDELEEKTGRLRRSLEEKEELLREIQHRVKNNLQTILSLINLQKGGAVSKESFRLLDKTGNHINSMAIVYDHLSGNRERMVEDSLSMKEFLEEYLHTLLSSRSSGTFSLESTIADVYLPRSGAIYCGLLLNELITAAVSGERSPTLLKIALFRGENDTLFLSVRVNNDIFRMIDDFSPAGPDNGFLDRDLVMVLAGQLNGVVDIRSGKDGSEFLLEWRDAKI